MAAVSGAKISTSGLVLCLDAANVKAAMHRKQNTNLLVDPNTWVNSSTGASTGYGANGSTTEQIRTVITDDPWGGKSTVWRTLPDDVSGADGGWNTSYYSIDTNKLYRWSVWVRRYTTGTGGTFYMGMNPAPIRNDINALQSNPYFTYTAQSALTLNQWYLVVGHCFPESYTDGIRHPDSGWYENGSKIADKSYGNVGTKDVRWNPGTTTALHRTYHYYTTNPASGLEFAYPRLDLCDGNQPSIQQLMVVGESQWRDASGNNNHGDINLGTSVTWSSDFGGVFNLDGSGSGYIDIPSPNLSASDFTVIAATRYVGSPTGRIISGYANNWLLGHHSASVSEYYPMGWVRNTTTNDTNWRIYTGTGNIGLDQYSYWENGEKLVTNSASGSAGPNGISVGRSAPSNTEHSNAQIGYLALYNRVLSDTEIKDAYNSLRRRYGL